MGAFEYVALNPKGREERGVREGDNPRQIRQLLREAGLVPLNVSEVKGAAPTAAAGPRARWRGMSLPELFRRVEHFCHYHHDMVEPVQGAVTEVKVLSATFDLHIVTSRCESLRGITEHWLERHFAQLITDIHFTNNFGTKHPERQRSKSSVCQSIGAVALIDDALSHASEVASVGIPVVLPNRPWNRGVTPDGVVRVDYWHEIPALVPGVVQE